MTRLKLTVPLLLLIILSACAKSVWAPDEAVEKATYVSDEPKSITLVTVINNRSGEGGHSGLIINASQKVVFDPAGNWKSKYAPERNDLVYGMNPTILDRYIGFHARKKYHVVLQTVEVTPEVAELAFMSARNNGAVGSGFCSNSVSRLLSSVPGFESIPTSLFPVSTMENFAKLPGVKTEEIYQDD